MTDYLKRIHILQTNLQPQQVFLLSKAADIQYYTGFVCLNPEEREAFVVVSNSTATLLYPSFSPVNTITGILYHKGYWTSDLHDVLSQVIEKEKNTEILLDKSSLFLNEFEALNDLKVTFKELDRDLIWKQRIVKDSDEIFSLKNAGHITAKVMGKILKNLKLEVTEKEIAQQVEIEIRRLGAETTSFPPVVAFGRHSALPHHQPTDTKLVNETVVLIDIGAKFNYYCGDMTRTVWFGKQPSSDFVKIEKLVKQAYQAALSALSPNASGADIDKAARDVIKKAGYEDKFIHTTGHGVGLEIHEQPSLYFKKESELPTGTVVTIEPGIYLNDAFGYRYENMVLIENNGCTELTI